MAKDAQWGQCAVAVPGSHLSSASSVLRGLASILLATQVPAALLFRGGWRWRLNSVRWRQYRRRPAAVRTFAGRLCTPRRQVRVSALVPASAVMAAQKGAVEVDADAVAGDSWVLVGQSENKGGVVTKADPPLTYAQAALWLAKEHHIWRKREIVVVLKWIPAEELGGLGQAITTWLSGEKMDKRISSPENNTRSASVMVMNDQAADTRFRVYSCLMLDLRFKIRINRLSGLLHLINNFMKALIPLMGHLLQMCL